MARSVLIVDDVEFVRKTLADILRQAHYQVVGEAADGNSAVEMFAKHRPDIVTMDVVMPHLSGIEASRKILKIDKNARIVIISAMGQESMVMEAINVGARDYLLKPFTAVDVLKTIQQVIQGDERVGGRGGARDLKTNY